VSELGGRRRAPDATSSGSAPTDLALRAALLRVVRGFAVDPDRTAVMRALLAEAVALVGADDGGLARWNPETGELRVALDHRGKPAVGELLDPAVSASGRAAATRGSVVVNDYQRAIGPATPAGRAGAQAVAAVPILHEDQLLGVLSITSYSAARTVTVTDLEVLELLAGAAAAALVGMERARLRGALLAADTAAAALRDRLAVVTGYVSMLAREANLSAGARDMAEQALVGAEEASELLERLRRLSRLEEHPSSEGIPTTIDLDRSTGPAPSPG
jgi:GAF domain-containing protein